MMKAAIYARKSTAQHVAEDAKSVAHQVARARQFSAQRGWTVVEEHVYVDDAASGAEFVEPLEVAALAFPVADRVTDELQRRNTSEIGDRKDRIEHGLKSGVLTLIGQHVHLQEPLVGVLLDFDQIGNLNRSSNFGKIRSLSRGDRFCIGHFRELLLNDNKPTTGGLRPVSQRVDCDGLGIQRRCLRRGKQTPEPSFEDRR